MGALVSCRVGNYDVSGKKNNVSMKGERNMTNSEEEEEAEYTICEENDIPNDGMKSFDVKGIEKGRVLIVKSEGIFSAVGVKCSHYGAPLDKGIISSGKIRCPFHGACFSLKTGDIEEFPGLDSIPSYEVRLVDGKIKIKASKQKLVSNRVVKKMSKRDIANKEVFVVVGGGAAGQKCVETLRQVGFTGQLVMVSAENIFPYDRPKISKAMHLSHEAIALRTEQFYKDADIELMLGVSATGIDESRRISLSDGKYIKFDKAFLATGGRPQHLNVPGSNLKGIYYLRTPADGRDIVEAAKGKKVVIIGTSFVGMEVAAYLSTDNRSSSVTVIGRSSVPFERSLGPQIGARVQSWCEDKGVTFHSQSTIKEIIGANDRVTKIKLSEEEIDADVIIAGIGVVPCTKFLKESSVQLNDHGYIITNEKLETSLPGLFCGGDIATFPLPVADNRIVNIGHWQLANHHGNLAALNMTGKDISIDTVPFFWTVLYGKSIRYAGYGSFDDIIFNGSLEEMKFIAYYCKGDRVVAVASVARDPSVVRYVAYVKSGKTLTKQEVLKDGEIALKLNC